MSVSSSLAPVSPVKDEGEERRPYKPVSLLQSLKVRVTQSKRKLSELEERVEKVEHANIISKRKHAECNFELALAKSQVEEQKKELQEKTELLEKRGVILQRRDEQVKMWINEYQKECKRHESTRARSMQDRDKREKTIKYLTGNLKEYEVELNKECPVCLNVYTLETHKVLHVCFHTICTKCFTSIANNKDLRSQCPQCKVYFHFEDYE
jgi:hypothetical protein